MQRTLDRAVELTWTMQDRTEDIGEHMMEAHRDFARRDGHPAQTLGEMRTVAFKEGSAEGCPDESFGDVFFGGIEGVQIGVALPLLEHELNLPAQPIGGTDLFEGKLRAREIGDEVAGLVLLCVPGHDQARLEFVLPLHIEIERFVPRHLRFQGRERLVAVAFDLAPLGGVGVTDGGIKVAFGLDQEKAAFGLDRGQIGLIEKHSIAEKVKGTPFLRQQVNGCFHHTAAAQFRKFSRRHPERRMYPRRVVRMDRAVDLGHKLA